MRYTCEPLLLSILLTMLSCGSPKISATEQASLDSISDAEWKSDRERVAKIDREADSSSEHSKMSFIKSGSYGVKLAERLNYLNQLDEVQWFEIDNNDVYIGFTNKEDMRQICNAAAFVGNKEIDFGCNVYALDANKYKSSKSTQDYIYTVTYRYGQKQ